MEQQKFKISFTFYMGTNDIESARGFEIYDLKENSDLTDDYGFLDNTKVEREYILGMGERAFIPVNGTVTVKVDDNGAYAYIRASSGERSRDPFYSEHIVRVGETKVMHYSSHESTMGDWFNEINCIAEVSVEKIV